MTAGPLLVGSPREIFPFFISFDSAQDPAFVDDKEWGRRVRKWLFP